jgi:hypothetical protein
MPRTDTQVEAIEAMVDEMVAKRLTPGADGE